jgi:hypothetical protein
VRGSSHEAISPQLVSSRPKEPVSFYTYPPPVSKKLRFPDTIIIPSH